MREFASSRFSKRATYKKLKKKVKRFAKVRKTLFLHAESLWRVKKVNPKVVVRKMKALESRSVLSRCVVCLRRQGLGWAQVFCGLYIYAEAGGLLCWWVLSTSCLQAPFHGININEQFSGYRFFPLTKAMQQILHNIQQHLNMWFKYVSSSVRV